MLASRAYGLFKRVMFLLKGPMIFFVKGLWFFVSKVLLNRSRGFDGLCKKLVCS